MENALYNDPLLYDLIVRPGPCTPFYRRVAQETGGPLLELACGTGRLTLPLAADGYEVVGVDASAAMLSAAAAKAAAANVDVQFVRGDIRSVRLRRRFALVIVSCNSLAHLTNNEDLRTGLANIKRHLAPGGLLAFDIVNPDIGSLVRPEHEAVRLDQYEDSSLRISIDELATYDPVGQIRVSEWRIREPARGRRTASFRLRLIFPQELPLLLNSAGLELVARYGDFDGKPLARASLNQVCIAQAS